MRALTVQPGRPGAPQVVDVPEPVPGEHDLLVDGLAVGVCGTDREIAAGEYGWAPQGHDRLVLGHESLGRVRAAPAGSGFAVGDLVAGVVRRPDPVPCGACAHGQFDMCRNGRYTERGIKELDGYASERWRVEANYAVRLDPRLTEVGVLMEPTSVVAKAWDQIEQVGRRSWFEPQRVLGAPLLELYSLAEIAHRHALRIAVLSAAGKTSFGLRADPDAVGGLDVIASGIEQELIELSAKV